MAQKALGTITVPTPGTPVGVSASVVNCQSLLFQALSNATHTNTGNVFILTWNETRTQKVRVATLAVPTANTIPSFTVTVPDAPGGLNPNDYSVFQCTNCHSAAQTNGEHSGVRGYVYNSTNCYQCHPRGNGGG